jgi:pilus assembly protein CpaD
MSLRTLLITTALTPLLSLAACSGNGAVNRGLESVHQPVVARKDYIFDVATSGGALAPGEAERLAGWMRSITVGYGDSIAVDDPHGGGGIRDDVQAAAARYGLLVSDDAPVTGAPIAPGTVRVVVSRMTATVPGCPDHSRNGSNEFLGSTTSNHGCAINSNLAAMVASPTDLVRGQPGSYVTDQAQATRAIDAYRRGAAVGTGGAAGGSTGGTGASAGSGMGGGSTGGSTVGGSSGGN